MQDGKDNKVDCMKCEYYAVSWDPNFPRSCKLHGFKSANMPSVTVLQSSGMECMGFVRKETNKE